MAVKVNIFITALVAISLAGCSEPYPPYSYFSGFRVNSTSPYTGVIVFTPNRQWKKWQDKEESTTREYVILSPYGACVGRISGLEISYSAEFKKAAKIEFTDRFGNRVRCTLDSADGSSFIIFPVLNDPPFLSDGNIVGELHFNVPLSSTVN